MQRVGMTAAVFVKDRHLSNVARRQKSGQIGRTHLSGDTQGRGGIRETNSFTFAHHSGAARAQLWVFLVIPAGSVWLATPWTLGIGRRSDGHQHAGEVGDG